MNVSLKTAAAAAVLFLAAPAFAQWPRYPTADAPKNRSGEPNLEGPVPKASDGKPDLSGIWERVGPGGINPDIASLQSPDGGPPAATFWNVGAGFEQGLPFRPLAATVARRAHVEQSEEQSRRIVPTDGAHAAASAPPAAQDRANTRPHRDHVRRQQRPAADLHGRAAVAGNRVQICSRGGTATRRVGGKATRSSSRRSVFATTFGSTCRAVPSRPRAR